MADPEVSAVNQFRFKVIEAHKANANQLRDEWAECVRRYRGASAIPRRAFSQGRVLYQDMSPGDGVEVQHNYLYALVDTVTANICPPNPEVTIETPRSDLRPVANLREAVVNQAFYFGKLHEKLWRLVVRAILYPRSFLKVVWSMARKRTQYRVLTPEFLFHDLMAEDWEDVRYAIEVVPLTRAEFERRIRKKGRKDAYYRTNAMENVAFGEYPDWLVKVDPDGEQSDNETVRSNFEWVVVYEYYDFVDGKFLHFVDGCAEPLFEGELPYSGPVANPFVPLIFNDNGRDLGGMSDASLVMPTLDRMNEMSSLEMQHVKTTIPHMTVHDGLVDDPLELEEGIENLDEPGSFLRVKAKPNVAIGDVLGVTPSPSLPVDWRSAKAELVEIVELVLGLAGYQRGAVGKGDIATEFALADTAIRTRNARRQKAVYDVIALAARLTVARYAQFLGANDQLPVPEKVGVDQVTTDRGQLMLDNPDGAFDYDFKARPFNAQEGNSVVQLKALVEFLPVFSENPATSAYVDQSALVKKLLELLHMPGLYNENPQPMAQPGGMPVPEVADTAGGTAGAVQGMPDEASPNFLGGQVMSGGGAQGVAGGLEGGYQGN